VLELIIWAKSLLFLFLVLWPSICLAWTGDVVGVADGDTITVLKDKTPVKIRLYGIDCPEKGGQAFGKKARQFTSKMVFRKLVEIKPVDKDRYGRTVAWVYVDGKNLCEELVINGLAWHYKRYSSDQKLADLENRARKGRVGLWSDPHAIPPWEFRRGANAINRSSRNQARVGAAYHGNRKSAVFHAPGCKAYNCKNCTVVFHSRAQAIDNGYRPCKICNP
jgi:endonuclease YncB( thermonuclease family)